MRGDRLRDLRSQAGESQAALGEALGITETAVANYETGRRNPEAEILLRLADHFGVSARFLMGLTDEPSQEHKDLPPGWEQVIRRAVSADLAPEDVLALINVITNRQKRRGD